MLDAHGAWSAGQRVPAANRNAAEVLRDGEEDSAIVPVEQVASRNGADQDLVPDLAQLVHLSEPCLLHTLARRYATESIYTYTGRIVIALNPFSWTVSRPLYAPSLRRHYRRDDDNGAALPPHLFALAERAHRAVRRGAGDQTVLVSGESGAGKTEAVKLLMQYLSTGAEDATADATSSAADAGGGVEGDERADASGETGLAPYRGVGAAGADGGAGSATATVAARVLATNPLLEAFGNAVTLRNANSSRFGKFLTMMLTDSGATVCGAAVHVYLLEKSRVIRRQCGERSFHVFYQMLNGRCATSTPTPHGTASATDFAYLTEDAAAAPPATDALASEAAARDGARLQVTVEAMARVGLSAAETTSVWHVLSAILLLGQIEFQLVGATPDEPTGGLSSSLGEERCTVAADCGGSLARVGELLGVCSSEELGRALTTRCLVTREEEVIVQLSLQQAADSRDALAKALYGRLFAWLVSKCNMTVAPAAGVERVSIGILDIFGFESFQHNSFEQVRACCTPTPARASVRHSSRPMESLPVAMAC